jgi:hypothetical protein
MICSFARLKPQGVRMSSSILAAVLAMLVAILLASVASASPLCSPSPASQPGCAAPPHITLPRPGSGALAPLTYPGSGELGGLAPADLRSAYKLPTSGGAGQTIGIVDAYNDPNAEADMNHYRSHYGLSECTAATGCFQKVNQTGGTTYPAASRMWATEISLDLDMVSATCPACHIILVEATTNTLGNLGSSVNEAASLGATEISNSYGAPEEKGDTAYNVDYNHPGIVIMASSGDHGYDNYIEGKTTPSYPATSPTVIAVGGTTLEHAVNSRGWSETTWSPEIFFNEETKKNEEIATGSGCSLEEAKPAWQTDTGCSRRMDNDISAVASLKSPVSVYDTYEALGWTLQGGTSIGSPIVAGAMALSDSYTRALGAEAFYQLTTLFDVTSGSNYNTSCAPAYFCTAATSFDGPTGLGTINGPPALTKWEVQSSPNPSTYVQLSSMSCSATSACTTVGYSLSSTVAAIAERWNGTTWAAQATATISEAASANLTGISCPAATACSAVGGYLNTAGSSFTLAEFWNGTAWSLQTTPSPSGKQQVLTAVSCTANTACTAVGNYTNTSGVEVAFAESWNGTRWTIESVPSPAEATATFLKGVSCVSTTSCYADGSYITSSGQRRPLAEMWNGTTWATQSIANPKGGELSGISCISTVACTAVGNDPNSEGTVLTLAERWNGTSWVTQPTPMNPPSTKNGIFQAVSCFSVSSCTAVGDNSNGTGTTVALAAHWNGVGWMLQHAAAPSGSTQSELTGVACAAGNSCRSAGAYVSGSFQRLTLAESYTE